MMADNDDRNAVELASAYLDGEATAAERALVESDAALMALVERLRQVRYAVADVPPAPPSVRDAAIAAALAAFDELPVGAAPPEQPVAPPKVASLERRRQMRQMQILTAAAAAAVLVIGGFVVANRGGDDDASTADEVQEAAVTVLSEAVEATPTTAPALAPAAAPTTTTARAGEPGATASADEAADAPMVAAPTEMATAESVIEAAGAPADASLPVLHDPGDLRTFAAGLADDPPAVDEVVADCEQNRQLEPDAEFEDANGDTVAVVVARTADGYTAVSLDDCTIVLRSSS
jgi:hypothetical protein